MIGADRYRNPDDDLPKDFESRRTAYYNALNLTSDARAFTRKIQAELERELRLLNAELPRNDKVRILWRGENRISITPFQPLPEPQGLRSVKAEIGRRWPMTELLDVLKETALDTGFLDAFETSASRVALSRGLPSAICSGLNWRHALRRSLGRSWRCRIQACALNCPICFQFFPASSTGRRSSSSMTRWSNMRLPCTAG